MTNHDHDLLEQLPVSEGIKSRRNELLLQGAEESNSKEHNLLKTIIDNVPELIFYKNYEGRYEGANKACQDFYRSKGVEHFLGKKDIELPLAQNFINTCIEHDQIVIASQKPLAFQETFVNENGHEEILETIKTPVFDKDGKIWGIVGVVRDITAQKLLEDKLRYYSYTDTLSGLYNRAYFNEILAQMVEEEVFPIGFILGDLDGLKIVNDTLGHLSGDKLIQETAKQLQAVSPEKAMIFRWGGDEFVILLPHSNEVECESLIQRMITACETCECENVKLSMSLGYSLFNSKADNIDQVMQATENKLYRQKMLNGKSLRSSILSSLLDSLESKNIETRAHADRVVSSCLAIGKALNLDTTHLDELTLVAKLHDIGKIGIPEPILLKPEKLTKEEFEIIKMHSEKGYRLTILFPELSHIARGILTHHEKWDGSGYPLGLKGLEIPLVSRIVSVADAYDAMTNDCIYAQTKSKEEALEEIKHCAGTHFDPHIVAIFANLQ